MKTSDTRSGSRDLLNVFDDRKFNKILKSEQEKLARYFEQRKSSSTTAAAADSEFSRDRIFSPRVNISKGSLLKLKQRSINKSRIMRVLRNIFGRDRNSGSVSPEPATITSNVQRGASLCESTDTTDVLGSTCSSLYLMIPE